MSEWVLEHQPCAKCQSSDAAALNDGGWWTCFSCEERWADGGAVLATGPAPRGFDGPPELLDGRPGAVASRGLEAETCRKFRYLLTDADPSGRPAQIATYFDSDGKPCAQKLRYSDKTFRWVGDHKRALLFGQQLWRGEGKRIIITEGEIDALSVSQAQGNRWPVVSVPDGATSARRALARQLEWLETFETIVLCFDDDEPGRVAATECAELFTPGKAAIAHLPLKDANEMLVAGRTRELVDGLWQAQPYRPDGIVEGTEVIASLIEKPEPGLSYPWKCMDRLLHGQRRREMMVWAAGTGIGKSQMLREVARHLHVEQGEKVGIIALEESVQQAALAQVSLELERPLHIPTVREDVSDEQISEAGMRVLRGMYFYDHWGSVDAETLLPKIRFMAKALDVRWFVLDHLSIMVSGMATDGDERKRIDEIVTRLRSLIQELDIGIHVVSHLRRAHGTPFEEGGKISLSDLRGSGAIGQLADGVVVAERNQQAQGDDSHFTLLRCLKNRFSGETGEVGTLRYDTATGRLCEVVTAPTPAVQGGMPAENLAPTEDF